ncbi:MAG: hypothetical protein OEY22_02070 [Candidatus Bathyarchaeota archaeon]|nr:hypothetical protein [Candidatus Bathyarchaeota archaeon]MDH5787044.1 hypothetical protein [Candidatus Bathyarchaeota archaeon]
MMKRFVLSSLLVVVLAVVGLSNVGSGNKSLACLACDSGVVDKAPCEAFIVKIALENTGESEGTWSVNVAFEGEKWIWSGTPQNLTLRPCQAKTLRWHGNVPCNATINSVARLIVYYNDSFTPLNWWIRVVQGAELTITSSTVE